MHPAFIRTDHRPWPLPTACWTWRQQWKDLLFAHWPVPAATLRPLVPAGLDIQEFDGTSWAGLVPFRMAGVMRRPLPDLPGVSAFPELNLRLYVERDGKPGVWFLSLDASNSLAVWAARRFFHLPYYRAEMTVEAEGEGVRYRSARRAPAAPAVFRGSYRPISLEFASARGGLEHFLTERYCLYAQAPSGALWRTDVQHVPWPLQRAHVEIEENTVAEAAGLRIDGPPALLHFSRHLDVVVWPPRRVG